LAFFENGFRNFTNSKRSLLAPKDFAGLKFRTMENPVHLASVRQLGAQAVPMSWGEVYTSLQTGVIDGQENPFFILTGNLMSAGGMTTRLLDFCSILVGWLRGGLAYINVIISMFFAGITGAAVADTSAVGAILIPAMKKEGYDIDFAAAVTATSSTIGPVIPPSIPFII
jgi:TRAP-type mannitol/chloroaromatic compound transport system permease large subunit